MISPLGHTEVAMLQSNLRKRPRARLLLVLGAFSALGTTGCQIDVGGQTLPSPYYLKDDIQYFPPGPEFKLSREAAAQARKTRTLKSI